MVPAGKLIGVLGGMGPAATADFMGQVIANTSARVDQEHIPLLIFSDPVIPDRSTSILDAGAPSPLPKLQDHALKLQKAGATALVIPCNTAHHFHSDIASVLAIPVLHIADAVCEDLCRLRREGQDVKTVALMATAGTITSGFYLQRLQQAGFECLIPNMEEQALINDVIRFVKGGDPSPAVGPVREVVQRLRARGADAVILGCTELPLLRDAISDILSYVDSTRALAQACIRYAREA
ncbi:cysteate racemase [Gluconobacter kanchanaburiensis]|uniref:Aspartate racemase n=1 Tax=Gluconobacter kanchanaburiensis NBRC 103587 TaxID=1307948 RepID=A0A511B7L3_9PROT|nr:amino acid racemase [Gluconobacter kanchanaburiensis]MBF0862442.1 aspartate/glutamate racemase family protein [Gluconobacter kanchanaburiensis]GBR68635.1 aspartate racemase [Gluconobacter kanchanaburiensis NBRC 103587]GEK96436.1 aspartate racemase [Gluconobacter kanchanaburiensis NBRC 103587]